MIETWWEIVCRRWGSPLEVVQSALYELAQEVAGVLPSCTALGEHHLVDCEASVYLEVVDGLRIGFTEVVLVHECTEVVVLGECSDPVDDDRLERVVEHDATVLTVGVDLVTEPVGAVVSRLPGGIALACGLRRLGCQELIDDVDEDILRVTIVDVEGGTVYAHTLTEVLNRDAVETYLSQHLQHGLLDRSCGVDGTLIRLALMGLVVHVITVNAFSRSIIGRITISVGL